MSCPSGSQFALHCSCEGFAGNSYIVTVSRSRVEPHSIMAVAEAGSEALCFAKSSFTKGNNHRASAPFGEKKGEPLVPSIPGVKSVSSVTLAPWVRAFLRYQSKAQLCSVGCKAGRGWLCAWRRPATHYSRYIARLPPQETLAPHQEIGNATCRS